MPTAPFIGRAAQLAEIEAAWAARRPGIVLITGEGGSGKSRLVAEVLRRLDLDGTAVLRGSARPQGAAPYDWLASVLNGRPAATLPVEESLLNRLAQRPLDAAEPRLAPATTLRAAVDVVRALLSGTATNHSELSIVVVEDLHDLDPASLALVAELAAAAETLPALMLVTSRPPQEAAFAPAAARTLRRLGGSPSVLRVHVAPFTARETAELIEATYGSAPAPEAVRGARRRTGGNPFWLAELLAAYDTAGDLPAAPLPPHVVGLLVEPLSSEPELVGRVARAAALLGDPVESDVLFHVCGGDVEPALRRLLDLGLLLIAPDLAPTGSLRFRHPLLREALAAGVMPRERTRVHSLARGLAVELGDNAALARHAAALGRTAEARTAAARGAAASLATGLPEAALELVALGLSLPVRTSDDGPGGGPGPEPPDRRSPVGLEQPSLPQSNTHDAQPDTQPVAHSGRSSAQDAQLTAHDRQSDARNTTHDGQSDAQSTAHYGQSGVQSTAHDAQSGVQSTAHDAQSDVQSTAHDAQSGVQSTAHDAQSGVQSTAHDAHKAQLGGHSSAQDAQLTAHDRQSDARNTAHDGQSDAQSTAHDAQSGVQSTAHDASRAAHKAQPGGHSSAQDAQLTAHDRQSDARNTAHDGQSDAQSTAHDAQSDVQSTAHDASRAAHKAQPGGHSSAQDAQLTAHDRQSDARNTAHDGQSDAQSTAHDAQSDVQSTAHDASRAAHKAQPGGHSSAQDAQLTAHNGQSDARNTAHDGQSDAQSTAHDASRAAHKAQPGGHSSAQDAQLTAHNGQSDAQSTARNAQPGARSSAQDAQLTAHNGQADAQSTAHNAPSGARSSAQDAQSGLSASARGGQSAVLDRDEVWVALAGVGAAAAFVSARFEVAANYAGDWLHEVQQTDDRDGTADAHRQLAAVRWCLGDPGGHRRSLDRAAAVGGSAASLARQRAAEAESALRTEDAASALPLAEAAVGAAERAGVGIASASVTLGTALALTGDFERGVALLRAARQLAGREHDPVTIGRAVHNLVAVSLPRLGEVMGWRLFDEAMGTIGRYGLEFCAGRTTTLGVAHAMRTGDLARAEALVWSRLPIEGDPVERVRFTARAGLLALERGDDSLAVRMLARADAEGRDSGLVRVLRVAVAARGVHPVDPAEALRDCVGRCGPARLAEAARWALHGGVPATVVEEHVPDRPVRLRFLLAVAAGRDADALELLPVALGGDTLSDVGVRDRVPAAGGDAGGLGPGGFGAGGTGIIGLISGDSRGRGAAGSGVRRSARRAAVAAVADGVGPDDEVGGGVEAGGAALGRGDGDGRAEDAAVHTAAAHALLRLGRAGEARRHAERAVALLAHWPGWRLAEAETLLHSLRAGGDLTARELEVLGCLAAGMTNQQVASSLGISIRTVAVHVSNLLRKTGATSRTEAALWAVRHRLAPER